MTVKPKRNQKIVGVEEREKMKEGANVKKEKLEETKQAISKAEVSLFEKSKENLPQVLESRLKEIETALSNELQGYGTGLVSALIFDVISKQTFMSTNHMVGYTSKELMVVFDAYRKLVVSINKKHLFVPDIANFCAYAGISSQTFSNYLVSPDDEKRSAATMVRDYLSSLSLDAGKMNRTNPMVTVHESKAIYKNVEAQAPSIIQFSSQIDLKSMQEKIDRISGKAIDAEYKEKENK